MFVPPDSSFAPDQFPDPSSFQNQIAKVEVRSSFATPDQFPDPSPFQNQIAKVEVRSMPEPKPVVSHSNPLKAVQVLAVVTLL